LTFFRQGPHDRCDHPRLPPLPARPQSSADSRDPVFSPVGPSAARSRLTAIFRTLWPATPTTPPTFFIKDPREPARSPASSVDGAGSAAQWRQPPSRCSPPDGSKNRILQAPPRNLVAGDTKRPCRTSSSRILRPGAVTPRLPLDANGGAKPNSNTFGLVFSPDGSRIMFSSDGLETWCPATPTGKTDIFVKKNLNPRPRAFPPSISRHAACRLPLTTPAGHDHRRSTIPPLAADR